MDETGIWIVIVIAAAFVAGTQWKPTGWAEDKKVSLVAIFTVVLMFGVPWAVAKTNEDKCDRWWEVVNGDARTIASPTVSIERAQLLAMKAHEDFAPLWCP